MALDTEQLRNARIIYQVGKELGLGVRDIQIGLITAMQESSLRNLNYGDRDSLGLFQQRPSQGWGTVAQVTDPQYAARKFFMALKGLGDSRTNMSMTEAAQAVQRSAYPDAYAAHIPLIRSVFPKISGGARVGFERPATDGVGEQEFQSLPGNDPQMSLLSTPVDPYGLLGPSLGGAADSLTTGTVGLDEPQTSAGTVGLSEPNAWMPILNPGTWQQLQDRDASGDVDLGYGKGVDGWRKAVVQAAKTALGTPYTWGGNSLQEGVDCSGLIQQAFAAAGMDMPRISFQQANSGTRVGVKALRPGDLVAWNNSSRNNGADHIALYIGNGQIIEAARPGTSVRIRKLGSSEGAYGVRIDR